MAKDPSIYLKALLSRKPRAKAGATAPRIERTLEPRVANPQRIAKLRELLGDDGHAFLPVSYPFIAAFQTHIVNMTDARFPISPLGAVHVGNEIVQHRPIGVDEPLRLVCAVDGLRTTEKGLAFDLEANAYVGDELVWENRAALIAGVKSSRPKATPKAGPDLANASATDEAWSVTPALARRYAWTSDDLNLVHVSSVTARLFGFRAPLLHGMWSVGRIAARHADLFARGARFQCDFKRPVLLPARLTYRSWRDDGGLAVRLLDERGEVPHLVGSIVPLA